MAYSTSNPPSKMFAALAQATTGSTTLAPVNQVWIYRSADATNVVAAAGYFTNALDLGIKQGDLIISSAQSTVGSTGIMIFSNCVQIVTSTGAVLGPSTVLGAT